MQLEIHLGKILITDFAFPYQCIRSQGAEGG